jgi:predicted nucleic acid-binding protein
LAYLDSSAFVKLPLREPEHAALREELARWDGFVSSALLRVEAVRACARYGADYARQAAAGLESVALLPLDDLVLGQAAEVSPLGLRSLDAIHLAAALSIEADLGAFVVYDERLSDAAATHGLPVQTPR